MIELKNIVKDYGSLRILKGVSFHVEKGEIVVLIGASGCGKTTTMKMINRLIEPSQGQVLMNGRDIREMDPIKLRLGIGYVTQKSGLIPHMNVEENIEIVPYLKGWERDKRKQRAREMLEYVNLSPDEYLKKMPSQLSGGQQQRISIARALASEPDLILMDEPFSALDPVTRLQLQNELKTLQTRLHKTFVIVSHDMNEALRLGDKIIFMDGGEIVQIGSPRDFLMNPANEQVRSFFSNASYLKNSDIIIAQDIALQEYPKIQDTALLREAAEILDAIEEDFILVVDQEGKYKGYLTVRDTPKHPLDTPVDKLPLRKSTIVSTTAPSEDLIKIFQTYKNLLFVPIEDTEGRLFGIMTRSGIIDYIVTTIEKERQAGNV